MLKDLTKIFGALHYLHADICLQFLTSKPSSVSLPVNFSVADIETGQLEQEMKLVDLCQYKSINNKTWKQTKKDSYKLSCIDSCWAELSCADLMEVKFGVCISWKRKRLRVVLSLAFIITKHKSPVVLGLKCNGVSFWGTRGRECLFIRISYCLQFLSDHLQFWLLG